MTSLYWHQMGSGDRDVVLLHGWGLNAEVWTTVVPRLAPHYRLHLVDLPGYGRSHGFGALTLAQMAREVLAAAPAHAVWIGWSLGGLVASRIALTSPQRVDRLITVASSPRFCAEADWPGIKPEVLSGFGHQLHQDFQRTVERFLGLQTLGTETARQDARWLKNVVLAQPLPDVEVLTGGLNILRTADLRQELIDLKVPLLRLYGYLDGLVPRSVVPLLDKEWPRSHSHIFPKAAHAPFISHPEPFCQQVMDFLTR
ncbi:pimeloyl-ACP methyl ester esterase BioH [Biostraticola tofi]|uniref:Pimeloyl-[acyl-carrier protein] methyl ester esterase n=1 Tax=Biostraticola tofi TaxID=466109 RepID=A0A4R3YMY6_9GAMM|nr:pimeloyl-ACP methyl ester esterase BioH [Biostraticola tofi]TCV93676.1 carboxylesterase BioH (pimeloyl-CoA synthesis) [Biostraticola tofi]